MLLEGSGLKYGDYVPTQREIDSGAVQIQEVSTHPADSAEPELRRWWLWCDQKVSRPKRWNPSTTWRQQYRCRDIPRLPRPQRRW